MVIANPRIHIICGVCGSKDMFTFEISKNETISIYIKCGNCATVTDLEELMEKRKDINNVHK